MTILLLITVVSHAGSTVQRDAPTTRLNDSRGSVTGSASTYGNNTTKFYAPDDRINNEEWAMTVSDKIFADLTRRLTDALIRFDCEYLAKDRDEIWRLQSELCAARHEELGGSDPFIIDG